MATRDLSPYPSMADIVKPGKHGNAKVEVFEISKADADFTRIRAAVTGCMSEYIPEGRYARLLTGGPANRFGSTMWMTDTPMEQGSNMPLVHNARGDVLIAGLGLGMVLLAVQDKPEVTSVTVLERDPDILALMVPQLPLNAKVTVVQADVYEWTPAKGQKFDTIWFDIWADTCMDNLTEDYPILKARYRKALRKGGWMKMWQEDWLRRGGRWGRR